MSPKILKICALCPSFQTVTKHFLKIQQFWDYAAIIKMCPMVEASQKWQGIEQVDR
jgi:hypothetical protein